MNQINEIAATIMAGLLASSDYTTSGDFNPGKDRPRYRPEVVDDSVALAKALIEKTKALETTAPQPADAS